MYGPSQLEPQPTDNNWGLQVQYMQSWRWWQWVTLEVKYIIPLTSYSFESWKMLITILDISFSSTKTIAEWSKHTHKQKALTIYCESFSHNFANPALHVHKEIWTWNLQLCFSFLLYFLFNFLMHNSITTGCIQVICTLSNCFITVCIHVLSHIDTTMWKLSQSEQFTSTCT